jgi:hypothetical protein
LQKLESEEFEAEDKFVFQIRNATGLYNGYLSSVTSSQPNTSASFLDHHPQFLFLSELLHCPIYKLLPPLSNSLLSITAHYQTFPLSLAAFESSLYRLLFTFNNPSISGESTRIFNNFLIKTLKKSLFSNSLTFFAQTLLTFSKYLFIIYFTKVYEVLQNSKNSGNKINLEDIKRKESEIGETTSGITTQIIYPKIEVGENVINNTNPYDPVGIKLSDILLSAFSTSSFSSSPSSSPTSSSLAVSAIQNVVFNSFTSAYADSKNANSSSSPTSLNPRYYQTINNFDKYGLIFEDEVYSPENVFSDRNTSSSSPDNLQLYHKWIAEKVAAFIQGLLYFIIEKNDLSPKSKLKLKRRVVSFLHLSSEKSNLELKDPVEKLSPFTSLSPQSNSKYSNLAPIASLVNNYTSIGPVVFITPEIRYTSSGHVGRFVDELTRFFFFFFFYFDIFYYQENLHMRDWMFQ